MALSMIIVTRMWQTPNSTVSRFNIPGTNIAGYMLERPGPDTTRPPLRLRVPEGIYSMIWHYSGNSSIGPYNPVPLLYNTQVPKSRYVLIHNGNKPKHTDGCLLIGSSRSKNEVWASVDKLLQLKKYLL